MVRPQSGPISRLAASDESLKVQKLEKMNTLLLRLTIFTT